MGVGFLHLEEENEIDPINHSVGAFSSVKSKVDYTIQFVWSTQ